MTVIIPNEGNTDSTDNSEDEEWYLCSKSTLNE